MRLPPKKTPIGVPDQPHAFERVQTGAEVIVIPEYAECARKLDAGEPLSALERFVYNQEPAGETDEWNFRADLCNLIEELRPGEQVLQREEVGR
jgi:hypothetical protein